MGWVSAIRNRERYDVTLLPPGLPAQAQVPRPAHRAGLGIAWTTHHPGQTDRSAMLACAILAVLAVAERTRQPAHPETKEF